MSYLPEIIDFVLTGMCNLRCPFCWGPKHEVPTANLEALQRVIQQLPAYSVRRIVFTGGEPTLVQNLPALLSIAKSIGLEVVLSTNGLLLEEKAAEIVPNVDWIGLPLDADSPDVNALMRPGDEEHFGRVLRLIPLLKAEYPQVKIKLRTVVCKINKDFVEGIPELVSRNVIPEVWRVYQVVYSSYGLENKNILELSDEEFEQVYHCLVSKARNYGMHLKPYRRKQRNGRYLFLEPNGDASVVVGEQPIVIGNFFESLENVSLQWRKYIDESKMSNHLSDY